MGLVSLSVLIACYRYWTILRTFGQDISLAATVQANLIGLVGGLLFFQVVGQTLSRWATLRRLGVSPASVVVTSLYERIVALVILLGAALIAAWILYDGVTLELQRESLAFAKSLLLLVLSFAAVSVFVLRRPLKLLWRSLRHGTNWNAVIVGVVLTIFVHGAMLAAYLSLILTIAPDISLVNLGAASVIIMLAASFPISFAGWGVRELGAVFAFGFVGVDSSHALAVSITIGILSIAAIAVLTGVVLLWFTPARVAASNGLQIASPPHVDLSRFLFLAVPTAAAIVIMFHVWLPVGVGFVNTNLADPMALMGGILFLLHYKRMDFGGAFPRIFLFICVFSLLILAGLIHGWWRFGYTDWAFVNRGVGWLFILGYVATGGILVMTSPVAGPYTIIRVLIWVAIIVVAADLVLWLLPSYDFRGLESISPEYRIDGEALNPNAFAFQLVMIFAGVLTLVAKAGRRIAPRRFESAICGLFFAAIYLTQSRTAFVATLVLLVGAIVLGFRRWDLLVKGAVVALFIVLFVPNVPYVLNVSVHLINSALEYLGFPLLPDPTGGFAGIAGREVPLDRPGSEAERWQSIRNGLALFREHPIFGAGLGAGMHSSLVNGRPLVIHSPPVWILAEFGLVGAVGIGAPFLSIAVYFLRRFREQGEGLYGFGFLIVLVFVVFGLPHDMFYQRLFWFLLGVVLFRGAKFKALTPALYARSHQRPGAAKLSMAPSPIESTLLWHLPRFPGGRACYALLRPLADRVAEQGRYERPDRSCAEADRGLPRIR